MKEYTLRAYAHMYAASERTRAYAAALAKVVQPGDVVVSLGSGVGLFPLLACRAGASKVYAIEAGSVIEIARRVIAQNGQASRVDLIHGGCTWTWQTNVSGAAGAREFRQSTFRAAPFPPMW